MQCWTLYKCQYKRTLFLYYLLFQLSILMFCSVFDIFVLVLCNWVVHLSHFHNNLLSVWRTLHCILCKWCFKKKKEISCNIKFNKYPYFYILLFAYETILGIHLLLIYNSPWTEFIFTSFLWHNIFLLNHSIYFL